MNSEYLVFLVQQYAVCFVIGALLPVAWPRQFGKKGITH